MVRGVGEVGWTSIRRYVDRSIRHLTSMRQDDDNTGMDENHLWVSLVLGSIGAGMFLYGKKAGRMVPLGAGLGLMVVPYFIPNVLLMAADICAITALPWIVRES